MATDETKKQKNDKGGKNSKAVEPKTPKKKMKPRGAPPPTVYDLPSSKVYELLMPVLYFNKLPKPKTEEEYIERFHDFFEYCMVNGIKPTVELFTIAMGCVYRQRINEWEKGQHGEFLATLAKNGKLLIQAFLAGAAANNDINPVVWIFYGKNYFGYSDKVEVTVDNNQKIDETEKQQIINQLPKPSDPIDV